MTEHTIRVMMRRARAEIEARRSLPPPAVRKAIRRQAGLTERGLGKALGVQPATISRWESSTRTPRGDLLIRYVAVLERLAEVVSR